jgi:methylenetetrahydrofolate reductase (NADPH)
MSPTYSFEIIPRPDLSSLDPILELLATKKPKWIDVTNHRDFNGAMQTSLYVKQKFNLDPAMHLRVGDPVQGLLEKLEANEIRNLFLIRGEDRKGPHTAELVQKVRSFEIGRKFRIGVAGYPQKHIDAPDLETDIAHLKAKVEAGADYVLSQIVFDNQAFLNWERQCRHAGITVPIYPGLMPLTEPLIGLVAGEFHVALPELLRKGIVDKAFGLEWMLKQIQELRSCNFEHVHIFVMNDLPMAERIVNALPS